MKKLLSILILFLTLVACKQAHTSEAKNIETTNVLTNVNSDLENKVQTHQSISSDNELTIQEFLNQLKAAIKNNDTNYIENSIFFPFNLNYAIGFHLFDLSLIIIRFKEYFKFHPYG